MNYFDLAVAKKLAGGSGGGGGSSDFTTASVTVESAGEYYWPFPVVTSDGIIVNNYTQNTGTDTQTVVLYKGKLEVYDQMADHVVSGSATLSDYVWVITGDCVLAVGIY